MDRLIVVEISCADCFLYYKDGELDFLYFRIETKESAYQYTNI